MHVDLRAWRREPLENGIRIVDPRGDAFGTIVVAWTEECPVAGTRCVTDACEYAFIEDARDGRVAILPVSSGSFVVTARCARNDVRDELLARFGRFVKAFVTGDDAQRARPPVHRPPVGWCGFRRPYVTQWSSGQTTIDVRDALPLHSSAAFTADLLCGQIARTETPIEPYVTAMGLRGVQRTVDDGFEIELSDDRFTYRARVRGDDLATFHALVNSIEPVPLPKLATEEILQWAV